MTSEDARDLTKSSNPDTGEPDPPAANQADDSGELAGDETAVNESDVGTRPAGRSEHGVELPGGAPPGKPDGEVDTRVGIRTTTGRP